MKSLPALFFGLAFAAGCSSTAPGDAATDKPSDVTAETPSDVATACPSLASYCATNHCVSDWSDAEKPSSWCTTDAGAPYYLGYADVLIQPACSGFDLVVLSAQDTGIFYLYDLGTGKLVGVGASGSWRCLAGTLPAQPFSFGCIEGGVSARVCGP